MAELKTKPTDASVAAFIAAIPDPQRRADCEALHSLMREATGCEPRMWGDSMVGFDLYQYKYASGRAGEWFIVGFSPRKNDLTLYSMAGFDDFPELMARLGKFKTGKACLYVKRLSDIHTAALRELIRAGCAAVHARWG